MARLAPLLAVLFLFPCFEPFGNSAAVRVPGEGRFAQAGVAAGTPLAYTLVVGGVMTSLLTLYVIVKAWNKAFWQPATDELPTVHLPRGMVAPTAALVTIGLALTVLAGPLYGYTHRAAGDLRSQAPYVEAGLTRRPW